MKTETELSAQFDRFCVERGWLDVLRDAFLAGFEYGTGTRIPRRDQNASQRPGPTFKGHPGARGEPNIQASDKQIGFLKALIAGDEPKARAIVAPSEYDNIKAGAAFCTKTQASDLIDKLLKAGLKPKPKGQPEGRKQAPPS